MKKTALSVLALTLIPTAAFCQQDAKSVTRAIVERTVTKGVAILKDRETTDAQKLSAFDSLLDENCHTDLMSMLALGKTGWASLNTQQRTQFTKAFVDLMKRTYYGKLNQTDVSHVEVIYKDNIEVSQSKRNLQTVMKNSGSGFNVDYKFALRNERWAIYDMEVEGISLIASYRSQFDDFLKRKSAAELIRSLESKDPSFQVETVIK